MQPVPAEWACIHLFTIKINMHAQNIFIVAFTFLWWWCWETSGIIQCIRDPLNQIGIIGVECYPSTLVNVQNPWAKYIWLCSCHNLHSGSIKRETQAVQLVDNSLEGVVHSTNNNKVPKVSKSLSLYQHFLVSCTQIDNILAIVPQEHCSRILPEGDWIVVGYKFKLVCRILKPATLCIMFLSFKSHKYTLLFIIINCVGMSNQWTTSLWKKGRYGKLFTTHYMFWPILYRLHQLYMYAHASDNSLELPVCPH